MTVGAGYDLKQRPPNKIVRDLKAIGIDEATAQKVARGFGLTGAKAGSFAETHKNLVVLTPAQERELLRIRVAETEDVVRSTIKVPLTQNQYEAMVSFAYNIGEYGFKNSDAAEALNRGDYAEAERKLYEWVKAGDDPQGLRKRRDREAARFRTPDRPSTPSRAKP